MQPDRPPIDLMAALRASLRATREARETSGEPPPPPRVWELLAEPGPEVTAVRDQSGHLWTREPDGWIYRTGTYTGRGVEIVYRLQWPSLYRYHAPLTDASGEALDA